MQRLTYLSLILISLAVNAAKADPLVDPRQSTVDFDTQIMPLLTRHGCNAGSCHGAAIGRGGFKLSLLGSDAAADHDVITRELEGRRVNRFDVERSLLLLKPSEQTGHEGGLVLEEDSPGYQLLRDWIDQGARRSSSLRLVSLETFPTDALIEKTGDSIPFSLVATFVNRLTDESVKTDVTAWTVLTPGDAEAVTIDSQSRRMTALRTGVHVVIARFMDRVLPIRLTVPMQDADSADSNLTPRSDLDRIDEFVDAQLQRLRIPSSPRCDDYAFLRRMTLDLCGRLPTIAETQRFVTDDATDKRSKKIDEYLKTREFADYWALKWANILMIDAKQLQAEGADAFHHWLADQIDVDAPLNQMAHQLVTAVGDSFEVGPANFSRFGQNPGDLAEHVSQVFMGTRLRCANCHNHPLDHWTQDDYHGLSAVFAKVKRGRVVSLSDRGEVTHPITRQPAVARIPGLRFLQPDENGREVFADWLSSTDNPYLAKICVNRLWRELMGRGLVEPVDDMRATNPATHPDLLNWLAEDFVTGGFRIKGTIATICRSDAYQRDRGPVSGHDSDTLFYSHAMVRSLEAEVIADAIVDVTGVPLSLDRGDRARTVALTNNLTESRSLDLLGRCDRSIGCDSAGNSSESLTRALHLINGPLLQERITSPDGKLATLLSSTKDNALVLDQLFLLTLSRPHASQSELWAAELGKVDLVNVDARRAFFEDILWGILASDAFATNH